MGRPLDAFQHMFDLSRGAFAATFSSISVAIAVAAAASTTASIAASITASVAAAAVAVSIVSVAIATARATALFVVRYRSVIRLLQLRLFRRGLRCILLNATRASLIGGIGGSIAVLFQQGVAGGRGRLYGRAGSATLWKRA